MAMLNNQMVYQSSRVIFTRDRPVAYSCGNAGKIVDIFFPSSVVPVQRPVQDCFWRLHPHEWYFGWFPSSVIKCG